jgi:hypothetical protein
MTVPSTSEDQGTRGFMRAFVLVAGVFAFIVWGSQAAHALDPSGVTAPVEAATPADEVTEAAAPLTDASEEAAPAEHESAPAEQAVEPATESVGASAPAAQRVAEPVTETVEAAAPAAPRVAEPVTETVEAAAPAAQRVARPVTEVVEQAAPDVAEVINAAPVDEVTRAAAPAVTQVVEDLAPVTQVVEDLAPVTQVVEDLAPVTQVVEDLAPVTQVVEDLAPVTQVVEDLAPVTQVVEDLAPVTQVVEDLAPVTQVVEDLAPLLDPVYRSVAALVENTVGFVTAGDTLPLPTLSSAPLLPTTGSVFVDPLATGSPQVDRSPWQAARTLLSIIVGEPSSLTTGAFMPYEGSGSPTDPDVPGPGRVPAEIPLADWGGILETGGRGLSQVAAFLSVAILLVLGFSRWIRPIAYARAPNPFLSSIELPG